MRQALVIVAKETVAGTGKAGLCPALTVEAAAQLSSYFLRDILALAASLQGTDVTVLYPRATAKQANPGALELTPGGADCSTLRLLFQRSRRQSVALAHVSRALFRRGYRRVILMASDTPTLPRRFLEEAFRRLNVHDVVLGPRLDGGCYLVALRSFHPQLFARVDWSGERILNQLIDQARALGLSVALLPTWYQVDTATDLERLQREARSLLNGQSKHTRSLLSQWGSSGGSAKGD